MHLDQLMYLFIDCCIAGKVVSFHLKLCVYSDFSVGNVNKGKLIHIYFIIWLLFSIWHIQRLSGYLSVCLSPAHWYWHKTNIRRIVRFSLSGDPETLIFETKFCTLGYKKHPLRWLQTRLGGSNGKNADFWSKTRYISETMEDRHIFTMED